MTDIDPAHPPAQSPTQLLRLPLSIQLLEALWLLWQSLASEGEAALQHDLKLDLRSFIVLSHLQEHAYQSAELAAQLMLKRYEMSRLLGSLEQKGLITRTASTPGDRRRVTVTLTPSGRQAWQRGIQTAEQVTRQYLAHLTPSEIQALIGSLHAITPPTGECS